MQKLVEMRVSLRVSFVFRLAKALKYGAKMVGTTGFEPATSPTPRVCASQAALRSDF